MGKKRGPYKSHKKTPREHQRLAKRNDGEIARRLTGTKVSEPKKMLESAAEHNYHYKPSGYRAPYCRTFSAHHDFYWTKDLEDITCVDCRMAILELIQDQWDWNVEFKKPAAKTNSSFPSAVIHDRAKVAADMLSRVHPEITVAEAWAVLLPISGSLTEKATTKEIYDYLKQRMQL